MSGRSETAVGSYRRRVVHVPMAAAVSRRNQVDPHGDLWNAVPESTGPTGPLRPRCAATSAATRAAEAPVSVGLR